MLSLCRTATGAPDWAGPARATALHLRLNVAGASGAERRPRRLRHEQGLGGNCRCSIVGCAATQARARSDSAPFCRNPWVLRPSPPRQPGDQLWRGNAAVVADDVIGGKVAEQLEQSLGRDLQGGDCGQVDCVRFNSAMKPLPPSSSSPAFRAKTAVAAKSGGGGPGCAAERPRWD